PDCWAMWSWTYAGWRAVAAHPASARWPHGVECVRDLRDSASCHAQLFLKAMCQGLSVQQRAGLLGYVVLDLRWLASSCGTPRLRQVAARSRVCAGPQGQRLLPCPAVFEGYVSRSVSTATCRTAGLCGLGPTLVGEQLRHTPPPPGGRTESSVCGTSGTAPPAMPSCF